MLEFQPHCQPSRVTRQQTEAGRSSRSLCSAPKRFERLIKPVNGAGAALTPCRRISFVTTPQRTRAFGWSSKGHRSSQESSPAVPGVRAGSTSQKPQKVKIQFLDEQRGFPCALMMMMAGLNIQAAKLTLTACPHSCPFQQAFGTQLLPKGDLGGSRVRTTEAL